MATTLKDIAARSGVSIKTVSRVLNKEPNVSADTRERVEEAAHSLGYRPNLAAKGLASSRSFLIALLYGNVSSSYVLDLMRGATRACGRLGYHLVVQPVENDEIASPEAVARMMRNLHVDGVVLTPPLCDNPALLDTLERLDIPAVRISPKGLEGANAVIGVDNYAATRRVIEYLIAKGHERIAHIAGPDTHSASIARREAYRDTVCEAGLSELVAESDFSWRGARRAAGELIERDPAITAIFAANDDMAAGVLGWMGETGRSCPEDIAVVGFDDTPLSRLLHPPLTTVGQDVDGMGARSVELLCRPDAGAGRRDIFALDLVLRASTGDG